MLVRHQVVSRNPTGQSRARLPGSHKHPITRRLTPVSTDFSCGEGPAWLPPCSVPATAGQLVQTPQWGLGRFVWRGVCAAMCPVGRAGSTGNLAPAPRWWFRDSATWPRSAMCLRLYCRTMRPGMQCRHSGLPRSEVGLVDGWRTSRALVVLAWPGQQVGSLGEPTPHFCGFCARVVGRPQVRTNQPFVGWVQPVVAR